jgi:hypothetical protein
MTQVTCDPWTNRKLCPRISDDRTVTNRARRQHVVSRFYLAGFANSGGQILRVTLPGDEEHILALSNASVVKDFYTVVLPDGTQSDYFERRFADLESVAAPAVADAIAGRWPLSLDRRVALAGWLALQYMRGENIRFRVAQAEAMMMRMIIGSAGKPALRKLIETAEDRSVPEEELDREWADLTKPGGPDLTGEPEQHLRQIAAQVPALTEYLLDARWALVPFSRKTLLTSDRPVALVAPPDQSPHLGVGILNADGFLAALGRRTGLVIAPRHVAGVHGGSAPSDTVMEGTAHLARNFNAHAARQAHRHIYRHPDDDAVLDGLELPDPTAMSRISATGMEDIVREEGILASPADEGLDREGGLRLGYDETTGLSVHDIPWPLPRRRTPWAS